MTQGSSRWTTLNQARTGNGRLWRSDFVKHFFQHRRKFSHNHVPVADVISFRPYLYTLLTPITLGVTPCPTCDRVLNRGKLGGSGYSPTVHRVFQDPMYEVGRCAIICKDCNAEWGDLTLEQMLAKQAAGETIYDRYIQFVRNYSESKLCDTTYSTLKQTDSTRQSSGVSESATSSPESTESTATITREPMAA